MVKKGAQGYESNGVCTKEYVNVIVEGQMYNYEWCTCVNEDGVKLVEV